LPIVILFEQQVDDVSRVAADVEQDLQDKRSVIRKLVDHACIVATER
jgi:hypothetical protein